MSEMKCGKCGDPIAQFNSDGQFAWRHVKVHDHGATPACSKNEGSRSGVESAGEPRLSPDDVLKEICHKAGALPDCCDQREMKLLWAATVMILDARSGNESNPTAPGPNTIRSERGDMVELHTTGGEYPSAAAGDAITQAQTDARLAGLPIPSAERLAKMVEATVREDALRDARPCLDSAYNRECLCCNQRERDLLGSRTVSLEAQLAEANNELDAARAVLEENKRDWGGVPFQISTLIAEVGQWQDKHLAADTERAKLVEALTRYGQHVENCAERLPSKEPRPKCTCGFTDAKEGKCSPQK